MQSKPNIILILNDDMGYSDIGCYGGEVQTPNLDSLAANGLQYTQFYNTARCCPSRASLLTGLYPHQADVGQMMYNLGMDGYLGDLNSNTVTIAEAMKTGGYSTYMSGKWHVTRFVDGPKHNWPSQRGFDDYYGLIAGCTNYFQPLTLTRNNERIEAEDDAFYMTDAITDEALRQIREHNKAGSDKPFFQYVAYTAPHWPLHAHEEDIEKYKGRFDSGWDNLRQERLKKMIDMGIIDKDWKLTERDPRVPSWENTDHKDWELKRMEVYAAQIDCMDQGIGRIMQTLKDTNQFDNTLIIFLSDNGGCAEEIVEERKRFYIDHFEKVAAEKTRDGKEVRFGNIPGVMPGGEETYQSYGIPWANLSNTPFRLYKHWVHEGGIATPFIAHWPAGIKAKGKLRKQPAQLPDIMATFLDIADIDYPASYAGHKVKKAEGFSLVPTFADKSSKREILYWEHEGNKAVRKGKWKLVCKYPGTWELYNMDEDRTELCDVSDDHPEIVRELIELYTIWADRCNVKPWKEQLARLTALRANLHSEKNTSK